MQMWLPIIGLNSNILHFAYFVKMYVFHILLKFASVGLRFGPPCMRQDSHQLSVSMRWIKYVLMLICCCAVICVTCKQSYEQFFVCTFMNTTLTSWYVIHGLNCNHIELQKTITRSKVEQAYNIKCLSDVKSQIILDDTPQNPVLRSLFIFVCSWFDTWYISMYCVGQPTHHRTWS